MKFPVSRPSCAHDMSRSTQSMKLLVRLCSFVLALACGVVPAVAKAPKAVNEKHFDSGAKAALAAMRARANELKIQGVAVVAFAPGDAVDGWISRMVVVGHSTDTSQGAPGYDLLSIAYAKAAETANTLMNSGTSSKPPMTGEYGWKGGVIAKVPGGIIIVAFSGGTQANDAATAEAGLEVLKSRL